MVEAAFTAGRRQMAIRRRRAGWVVAKYARVNSNVRTFSS